MEDDLYHSAPVKFSTIRYPLPLRQGDSIGITAPSSGESGPPLLRLDTVLTQIKNRGFHVREGLCLRKDFKHVSGTAKERFADLLDFWKDPKVRAIIPPWGGELLIEILKEIDFETVPPKWILGYSDTSTLLFALTLSAGIATAHGSNLMDLIENQVEDITNRHFEFLSLEPGRRFEQMSFSKFQTEWKDFSEDPKVLFNVQHPVIWKSLRGNPIEKIEGRLIGGCLDTIVHLVGTPYGDLPNFASKFSSDGTILYLENCELTPCQVARSLWQMRYAGWFENIRGVIFGRSSAKEKDAPNELNYRDAVSSVLGDQPFPVILDADIGHQPPQMMLINGAKAVVELDHGKGKISQMLN